MKTNKITQMVAALISLIILVVAVGFMVQNFLPQKKTPPKGTKTKQVAPFNNNIDNETLIKIKEFTDYGLPEPSNLGKVNPFILEK